MLQPARHKYERSLLQITTWSQRGPQISHEAYKLVPIRIVCLNEILV